LAIEELKTTVDLHRCIAADPRFRHGGVDTCFFEGLANG
jgi:acetyl-CoA carboxylase biotin carboxylase subunit